jgi:hypothetical protein
MKGSATVGELANARQSFRHRPQKSNHTPLTTNTRVRIKAMEFATGIPDDDNEKQL